MNVGAPPDEMLTSAEPLCVGSAADVAVTVTTPGDAPGAVYSPAGVIVPSAGGLLLPARLSVHETPVLFVGPFTVAVNWNDSNGPIVAVGGVTCTVMPDSIVRLAIANALESIVLVTRITAVFGVGNAGGAV